MENKIHTKENTDHEVKNNSQRKHYKQKLKPSINIYHAPLQEKFRLDQREKTQQCANDTEADIVVLIFDDVDFKAKGIK